MKFKISHSLVDTLEARDHLHANIPIIRAMLVDLLGKDNMDERTVRTNLLVHECFSMIGLPKKHEVTGKFDLKTEIEKLFSDKNTYDPFVHTTFAITEKSIEFQDKILTQEVLEAQEDKKHDESSFIDLPIDIHEFIIDKVLAANGNLTMNFYGLVLLQYVNSEFGSSAKDFHCYKFLEFYSSYINLDTPLSDTFTEESYEKYVEYFAYLDEHEESTNDTLLEVLANLQNDVSELLLGSNLKVESLIETLLIKLLGHENSTVRLSAIKYLNCLYDGTLWKMEMPSVTEVRITGDSFKIKFTPTVASTSYYIALNLPSKYGTCISYHRIPKKAKIGEELTFDLGKFKY